jgi:hypothetical protein
MNLQIYITVFSLIILRINEFKNPFYYFHKQVINQENGCCRDRAGSNFKIMQIQK